MGDKNTRLVLTIKEKLSIFNYSRWSLIAPTLIAPLVLKSTAFFRKSFSLKSTAHFRKKYDSLLALIFMKTYGPCLRGFSDSRFMV